MAWAFSNDRPIYAQIVEQILAGILGGRYGMGDKLPSVRDLATEAAVNPNTMQRAFSELESLGLVTTARGAGRFVTEDGEVIESARENKAREFTIAYLENMNGLGYSKERVAGFLEGAEKGQVDDGNNS